MSVAYKSVQWNPFKQRYDLVLAGCVLTFFSTFFAVGKLSHRAPDSISDEILLMRAFGVAGFVLLNITLCIGPLARIDHRFLPLLYNRRHLGVLTFFLGLFHVVLGMGFYHGFGRVGPLQSLLTSNTQYRSLSAFPFEVLGLLALAILFLMAATSHDFWLKNLSPRVWKSMHMMVYLAWGALLMHVALGALQAERSVVYTILTGACVVMVPALHLVASRVGIAHRPRVDVGNAHPAAQGTWLDFCDVSEIPDKWARVVTPPSGERIAIFRVGDELCAISNICAHQGGPLGEGKIVDGCVTCPWHGYQYRAQDGCAPPPFTEKLPTYALRVESGRVWVNIAPQPPGTFVEPAKINNNRAPEIADA